LVAARPRRVAARVLGSGGPARAPARVERAGARGLVTLPTVLPLESAGGNGFPYSPHFVPLRCRALASHWSKFRTHVAPALLGHDNVPVPVAFVLSSFDPGGTERQMIELIRRLDRKRWQVHLVCFRASGAWYERAAEAAESVATFPIASFLGPEIGVQLRRFARWCRDQRIAVVHTGQLHSNIFGLPGAALARVPVRVADRRMLKANKPPMQLAVQRVAYAFAHKVVANSLAAAARLKAEGVPARKIAVITNGVDCDRFTRVPSRWSARRVVMVANLRPEKGHDVLIAGDAAALAERICGLMADPGLAGAFGVAGRAAIDARYTFERMVGAFDRLYETELRRRCPVFRWHAAAA